MPHSMGAWVPEVSPERGTALLPGFQVVPVQKEKPHTGWGFSLVLPPRERGTTLEDYFAGLRAMNMNWSVERARRGSSIGSE